MKKLNIENGKLFYTDLPTPNELALALKKPVAELIKFFFSKKIMVTFNQALNEDQLLEICVAYGLDLEHTGNSIVKDTKQSGINLTNYLFENSSENKETKAPVITIMGHVDHGKTSLLDAIRKTKVANKEHGGITQHIGAYQIKRKNYLITFIDTPGHEAFTHMRARGAKITDIVVLVVAADDGVKPQTKEAIDHAKSAKATIIVAINKIDKVGSNPEKVKQQLSDLDLVPEEWGGTISYVEVSAKTGVGLDLLLDTIHLHSEVLNLKCNTKRKGYGIALEAKVDKSKGTLIDLIVQNGIIKTGDFVVCGTHYGKIKALINDEGKQIKEAIAGMPIEILGLSDVPDSGDMLVVFGSEKEAKDIATKLQLQSQDSKHNKAKQALMDFGSRVANKDKGSLNVILRTDVQGTAEAIVASLKKIKFEEFEIKVIRNQTGTISISDVELAMTTNATIVGFNIRPSQDVVDFAKKNDIEIHLYTVIYKLIEELEAKLKGLLKPDIVEEVQGQVEVRKLFKVDKIGTIAGSYVLSGEITRNSKVRVLRAGVIVYDGLVKSLKHLKNDVANVKKGFECGVMIEGYNDLKEQDVLEAYINKEVAKT